MEPDSQGSPKAEPTITDNAKPSSNGKAAKATANSKAGKSTSNKPKQKAPVKGSSKKAATGGKAASSTNAAKDGKVIRSFPASTYENALEIPSAIQKYAGGQKIRRFTLFDYLKKSPESGISRQLLINASRYGLTVGGYKAEFIELTEEGKLVTSSDANAYDKTLTEFKLAIDSIKPFHALYEQYKNSKLPLPNVLKDFLLEQGYHPSEISECIDTFTVNAKYIGLLRVLSGTERLILIEAVLENISNSPKTQSQSQDDFDGANTSDSKIDFTARNNSQNSVASWSRMCFYITPIGADASEDRKHSDLFLESIVVPALKEFDLTVVRADQIGSPGMISSQIIEHIMKCKLVIADLSFHNPNVFYELAIRHMVRLPTVQIIRKADRIPFRP